MGDHKEAFENLMKARFSTDALICGIEIGCYKGEFDAYLLRIFNNLRMTTIEPFVLWPQVVINNMEYLDRLCILQMTSDMACKVLEGLYDFIFIDGEHEYGQCKRDILNYRKFIKSGGIIAGHNFETHARATHPGVAKAVIEIFADNFKLTKTDCVWYVEV